MLRLCEKAFPSHGRKRRGWWFLPVVLGFSVTTLGAPPTIFRVLDPVRPNETLLLFGADISSRATAEGFRLADSDVSAPPQTEPAEPREKSESLQVLQASSHGAKVLIPPTWAKGIYAVRLRNADGQGKWHLANRPEIWWQLSGVGGIANPGGEIRIFGKNFGPKPRVWLVSETTRARELPVVVGRPEDVTAQIPADLAPGAYRLWLHGGFGGEAGFAPPLPVQVGPEVRWPETVFNVIDFGARGSGEVDDTPAIRRALKKAEASGGGVVLFPAGTYLVTGKLVVPPRTVLRGAGREETWLKVPYFRPGTQELTAPFETVIAGNGNFAVEDLSITAQAAQRLIAAPDIPETYASVWATWPREARRADSVRLERLRLEHLIFSHRLSSTDKRHAISTGPATIAVKGADFTLRDSTVISSGMPIQIASARRAKVCRNALRTGRNGWYGFWDLNASVFEENDIAAADLEGSFGGVQGACSEVMFRANRWHDAYGDEREALTFDTPYLPAWMGRAKVAGTTLHPDVTEGGSWPLKPNYPDDLLALIVGGRGAGQAVPVVASSADVMALDRPFTIEPDSRSLVVVAARKQHVLVVDNAFADASVAVQLFYQTCDFLIARNTSERTGGSYAQAGDFWDGNRERRFSYAWFNQWLDNTFRNGRVYDQGPWASGYVGITATRSRDLTQSVPAIGNRFVGNRLLGGSSLGVTSLPGLGDPTPQGEAFSWDTIFEHNEVSRSRVGIRISEGQGAVFLRDNQFPGVPNAVDIESKRQKKPGE